MIFGLIPIGGKGTRLSLPFSKEMLPQKNFGYFNPVANHLVEKMLMAGAEKIVFVHGSEIKADVAEFFAHERYLHVQQSKLGFARVLYDFIEEVDLAEDDKVMFGLPDSVFDGNPFIEMVDMPGIVAGVFQTFETSKVDRLNKEGTTFQVKISRNENNQDWFWGVLKFDACNLIDFNKDGVFDIHSEIGEIVNKYQFSLVKGRRYVDIGTWDNYNRYISDTEKYSNSEIEKKYDASAVREEDFNRFMNSESVDSFEKVESTDHYFVCLNETVEFVRFREKAAGSSYPPDITVKNSGESTINRFELEVPLSDDVSPSAVLQLLKILGLTHKFNVRKSCNIYGLGGAIVVFYTFDILGKEIKFIEIELTNANYGVLLDIERRLAKLPGFDAAKVVNMSKFKIISKLLNGTPYAEVMSL